MLFNYKYVWHLQRIAQLGTVSALVTIQISKLLNTETSKQIKALRREYEAVGHMEVDGGSGSLLGECIMCVPL